MFQKKSVATFLLFAPLVGCMQTDPQNKTESPDASVIDYASMEDTASLEALNRMREDSKKWDIPKGLHPNDMPRAVPSKSVNEPGHALGKTALDPYCMVWADPNYTGRSLRINPNDDHLDLRHTNNGSYNDMITSVQVFNNLGLWLYRDLAFAGGGFVVSSDIPNLQNHGFNDYTTSIAWADRLPAAPNSGIRLHANLNMTGASLDIQYPVNANSLTGWNFNDIVSSAGLINGETKVGILYEHPNWTGASFTINAAAQNVPAAFNDRATAFRWAGT